MRIVGILSILILAFSSLQAQEDAIREADIKLQSDFIEANREKLLGNYEKAADAYKAILKKNREKPAVHYELARVLAKLERVEEAQKAIKNAIELDANNVWYQFFQAELYELNSDDQRAAEVYAKLVKRDPDNAEYYYKQAFYLVRARDLEKAIGVYDALEKRVGITEEIIRRKHTLYMGAGDMKKAAKEMQRLADAFPKNVDYLHLLAGFYEQTSQEDKAKATYKRILEVDATDAKAQLALQGNKKSGSNNALQDIFQKADVGIDLKIRELMPYIAELASGNRANMATGLALGKTLTEVHPEEAKAAAAYGDLLYHSGDIAGAQQQYERTLELDDTVYAVWEQLMYVHQEQNQYKELAKVSENAMDIFPNQARVYYMNAIAQNSTGDYEDAVEMLEEGQLMVGKDMPLRFDIYTQLGAAYYGLEKYEAAKEAVEEALKINTQAYPIIEKYGDILFQLGQSDEAVAQWKRAKKLGASSEALERKIADKKL